MVCIGVVFGSSNSRSKLLPLVRVGGVGSVGFVRHSTGTVVTQRSGAVEGAREREV